jgi:hypothetical protein
MAKKKTPAFSAEMLDELLDGQDRRRSCARTGCSAS